MVAGMSRGKKAYAQYERQLSDALARLAELREQFKASIDADAASFNEVMAAFKKAKEHPEAQAEVEAATKKATLVPLLVAERAREVRQIVESLRPITNPKMASDLAVGMSLARAAVEGALANVEINLADIKDEAFIADVRHRVAVLRQ
jgi:formiminotetrahydrofolate cyclodeaminase